MIFTDDVGADTVLGAQGSLDDAYNVGETIDVDGSAVALSSTAEKNGGVLSVVKNPSGVVSGHVLDVEAGANTTGDAIAVTGAGSGFALKVYSGNVDFSGDLTVDGVTSLQGLKVFNDGTITTTEFLNHWYENVFGRAPVQEGFDFWSEEPDSVPIRQEISNAGMLYHKLPDNV